MKNDIGIKLLIDEMKADTAQPPAAEPSEAELERIDALLRRTADECTAEIDFEAIKLRAVSAAKAKKSKRGRFRKAASYALFACAALVLGVTMHSVIKSARQPVDPGTMVYNSPGVTGGSHRGSPDGPAVWRVEGGTVSNDQYKVISKHVSDLFPDGLPETMTRMVEDSGTHAIGTDRNGAEIGYDFVMSTEPPIPLEMGEACSVEDGEYLVYYWQVTEENCVSLRFTGFEQRRADYMFDSLAKRIVQIVPNDGQR